MPPWLPLEGDAALSWYTRLLTEAGKDGGVKQYDKVRAWLGQNDLFFLLTVLLGRKDVSHPWVFERCREVQASPDGHLDLWAREHYKSTIITYALTIQDILNNPEETVGIFSHTRGIAKGFLRQIMREFERNEALKRLYPGILYENPKRDAPKWSEDDGLIVKRKSNPKESTVEAWGLVDGQPTSRHFSLRVYDDTVTRESVTTPGQIKAVTEAWELSDNLGTLDGRVRYIGTRYAMFDTYSVMLERGVVSPRVYPATDNGRLDGNPVLFSPEVWEAKKRIQRSTLAAQMLQNPLSGEDQTFEADWLLAYELRPRIMNVVIVVDPSLGRSSKSDRTAIAVIGIAARGTKYLLDGYCHRMRLSERWQNVRNLHRKWSGWAAPKGVPFSGSIGCNVVGVGYERYGQQADTEYFQERMRIEEYPFGLSELAWPGDGTRSKETRIARLEPDFKNGRFYLPLPVWRRGLGAATWAVEAGEVRYQALRGISSVQTDAVGRGDGALLARAIKSVDENGDIYDLTIRFVEEFIDHPYGQHDDLIDAVSRVYDMQVAAPAAEKQVDPPVHWDA